MMKILCLLIDSYVIIRIPFVMLMNQRAIKWIYSQDNYKQLCTEYGLGGNITKSFATFVKTYLQIWRTPASFWPKEVIVDMNVRKLRAEELRKHKEQDYKL